MKKKIRKIIAVYLALNLLFEIVAPTVAFALTNGPSQPEMESFEPIGTTEMVDPFSGDFNYNIPLMTVPGPNGGYPINMAYHAGIGMEQEASWVGLGWNINAGEISRQMRGLPDDFNGDPVNQTRYMTPNITASLTGKASAELLGLDASIGFDLYASVSLGLVWNSYQGIGITSGQGINAKLSGESNSFSGGLNTNYNSLTGTTDLSPSLSYTRGQGDRAKKYGLSFTRNSLEGVKSMDFSTSWRKFDLGGGLTSFSGSSFIPHADMPNTGFSVMTSFDMGIDIFGVNPYVGVEASYSQNKIATHSIDFKAYGYFNSQNRDASQNYSLMDFNREKDHSLTKDIPALPMPMFTNDIYFVKGQGVGGAFRPYRSDIGILKDPVITSTNYGGSIGVEVGTPPPTLKIATDITLSYSKAYSGPWRDANMWSGIKDIAKFEGKNTDEPLYEPYYFKNAGDMTANFIEESRLLGPEEAFPIKMAFGISASDFASPTLASIEEPLADVKVENLTTASAPNLLYNKLQYRQSRTQMMSLKTRTQMDKTVNPTSPSSSSFSENTIYDLGSYPRIGNAPTSYVYNTTTARPADHTAEITVVNPDGNRYVYGIPAYNTSTKEVSFSVDKTNITENPLSDNNRLVDYTVDDASAINNKNDDHFYNSKSLPPYAHSYLLTAIVSPDYVDLTNNGLTADDYGYYTKFNYTKLTGPDYKWRSPYRKASFIDGFRSISNDDKAGYVYGEKEIWYLNSVETKTHVAEFHLSPRQDGFGAVAEKNDVITEFGKALQKLDKIDLYSKNDPSYITGSPVPIKTVNFEYTYDLCGFVGNNDGHPIGTNYYEGYDRNANSGKLTLKKVWFTFLGNQKGSLSPYEFDYNERVASSGKEINLIENPNYSVMKMDRWGNYKAATYNEEDPYVNQSSDAARDANSSAWCLKGILLPSGGKIKIEYESDDYAYVQDQQAMQMAKIVGTAQLSNGVISPSTNAEITGDFLYLLFELENQAVNNHLDIYPYVKNIQDMYFKTYQKLKKHYATADPAYDYVNGYAKVEGSNPDGTFTEVTDAGPKYGFITYQGNKVGYVKLAYVNVHDSKFAQGLDHTNPLRKAGFQYLKLSRPDLLSPSSTNNLSNNPTTASLLQLATATISYFSSNVQLLTGYYNYCMIAGFCKKIEILPDYPSFIRVNSPDKIKYGGGHRVKRIVETDTWTGSATSNEYGQEYSYRMPDQTSSGVACYEPLIGGEEIPLHQPIRYNSEYFIVQRHDLYMEYPYCESYYPGAQVGYSRVIVKGIQHTDALSVNVNKGTQGITLYEFYTAKDFPVSVKSSDLPHPFLKLPINIPFVGNISFDNHGFSQNFTVETNDMNGKLKGVSTYPYGTIDLTEHNAVSKTNYIYKTDAAYNSNGKNQLNNSVDVLFDDAYHKTANIGLTKENFIDMRERSSISMINGGQLNMEYTYPFALFFSFFPRVNYSESLNKTIVSMNVINRNGILMETQQLNEGSLVKTTNLMFDAATGDPLLTTVTNDFDKPVYSYDYAAQWAYDGMGGAYKNTGAVFSITSAAGGICQIQLASGTVVGAPEKYLSLGDEVSVSTDAANKYWVTNINPGATGDFTLETSNESAYPSASPGIMTIMRSGRRNLQNVSNGSIVSLSNSITERLFPLFDKWNTYFLAHSYTKPPSGTRLFFTDCVSGENVTATVTYTTPGTQVIFSLITGWSDTETAFWCSEEQLSITFPVTNGGNYMLQKSGNKVYATLNDLIGSQMVGTWADPGNCLKECLPDVLHASSSEFKDNWSSEIDIVQRDIYNNQTTTPAPFLNAYASGRQGIWRTTKTNVFQVDRKRNSVYTAATDISKDGTFTNFVLFDWTEAVLNPLWTTSSTVSKINPYGYEIENKDALGIFSSAMYGYNNSLQTAIATNAQYYETAFDGFEDYASTYASHGHINLDGTTVLSAVYAHTGKKSLLLGNDEFASFTTRALAAMPSTDVNHFTPLPNKKYLVSTWYRSSTNGTPGAPAITVTGAGTAAVTALSYSPVIDGWIKAELAFTTVATADPIVTITITGNSTSTYVDDIRIQPFQSTMKTYVYDPEKLWLKAELDNQNFATFYNYDQEGTMFQVKKETVKGVSTIKTTSSNIKRRLP